jgi:citrate lyase subunit beta/citryl-CoA lyase
LLIATIETPRALLGLATLPDLGPQVVALALGDEDRAAAIGCDPPSETVRLARQMLVLAAAAQERPSLALVSPNFRDLQDYRIACERARKQGLSGGLCIHPAQVPLLNDAFSPTAAEIAAAERVVAANACYGATSVDGAIVDRPVVLRAAALLARAMMISARERNHL